MGAGGGGWSSSLLQQSVSCRLPTSRVWTITIVWSVTEYPIRVLTDVDGALLRTADLRHHVTVREEVDVSDGLGVAEDAGRRVEHVHELSVTHVQAVVHGHVLVPELRRVQPCNTTCTALLLSLSLRKFVAELVTAQVRVLSVLESFTLHCVSSLLLESGRMRTKCGQILFQIKTEKILIILK